MNASELLPLIRGLYTRLPETRHLLAWELRIILWSLGYTDDLADEAAVEAARDVALTDLDPDRRAAYMPLPAGPMGQAPSAAYPILSGRIIPRGQPLASGERGPPEWGDAGSAPSATRGGDNSRTGWPMSRRLFLERASNECSPIDAEGA